MEELLGRSCWGEVVGEELLEKLLERNCWGEAVGELGTKGLGRKKGSRDG